MRGNIFEILFFIDSLCSSSPNIQNGLDIGRQAELYTYERRFDSALQSFTSALSILVPLLNSEPKGERRTLLYQQVRTVVQQYKGHSNVDYSVFISIFRLLTG